MFGTKKMLQVGVLTKITKSPHNRGYVSICDIDFLMVYFSEKRANIFE